VEGAFHNSTSDVAILKGARHSKHVCSTKKLMKGARRQALASSPGDEEG
jgi:hypothetical protein